MLVSAGINIGLGLFMLSLFSILKKQPAYAPIYYPRRLSLNHQISFGPAFSGRRLIPSVEWLRRAIQVTEDEILDQCGLDVLVFIRLFKFGIKFFLFSSVVGLVILLPVNYGGEEGPTTQYYSMDSLTISNVTGGSNRLWVHLCCLYFVSCYGLYLLYKEYKEIWLKRTQQLHRIRNRPDQFTVLVREIPFCSDHKSYGCSVDHFFSKSHQFSYHSYQILYNDEELERLLISAKSIGHKLEILKKDLVTRNRGRQSPLLSAYRVDEKIDKLEGMLQEISEKIELKRCKRTLEQKELPVAFVTFRSRCGAALAAQSQQLANPLVMITQIAPEPRDVQWSNLSIRYRIYPLYKLAVYVTVSLFTVFFAIPVTAVQGIAKFERLRKWFPPAMALQLIPGLRSVITGYLPSLILNLFIYIAPFCFIGMAKIAGYISRSKKDIRACNMVFYFLVGNVFFLSLLSGSLLDQIGESFAHPKSFPAHLASAVSAQGDFFMTYILTSGLFGFSLEILQPGLLTWDLMKYPWNLGKNRNPYTFSLPYYRNIPFVSLSILIGMVYAVVSPLLLPFLVSYFLLGYAVFINQIQDVYIITYETCGQYWPYIHHYIIVALILMQVSMIGLFGLKSKPSASVATVPLLVLTVLFNEYCKIRFLPSFRIMSLQDAKTNDELDEKNGLMEANFQRVLDAYSPPCMRPMDARARESC